LHKRVLDVARVLFVDEEFGDLLVVRRRPNQVFHQNKNGMSTISRR